MNIRDMSNDELRELAAGQQEYVSQLKAELRELTDQATEKLKRLAAVGGFDPIEALDDAFGEEQVDHSNDRTHHEQAPNGVADFEGEEQAASDEGGNLFIDEGAKQPNGNTKYRVLDDDDKQVATLTGKGRSWDVYVGKRKVAHGNTKQRAIDAYVETL